MRIFAIMTGLLLTHLSAGCGVVGDLTKGKKSHHDDGRSDEVDPGKKEPQGPNTPSAAPAPAPAPGPGEEKPAEKTDAELCSERGSEYAFESGECRKLPELKLSGIISPEPGLVWEANSKTCEKLTPSDGERFRDCRGFDVTMPLKGAGEQRAINTLKILFDCRTLVPLNLELSFADGGRTTLGPSKDPSEFRKIIDGNRETSVRLHLPASSVGSPVLAGCRVEIVENSAVAID